MASCNRRFGLGLHPSKILLASAILLHTQRPSLLHLRLPVPLGWRRDAGGSIRVWLQRIHQGEQLCLAVHFLMTQIRISTYPSVNTPAKIAMIRSKRTWSRSRPCLPDAFPLLFAGRLQYRHPRSLYNKTTNRIDLSIVSHVVRFEANRLGIVHPSICWGILHQSWWTTKGFILAGQCEFELKYCLHICYSSPYMYNSFC